MKQKGPEWKITDHLAAHKREISRTNHLEFGYSAAMIRPWTNLGDAHEVGDHAVHVSAPVGYSLFRTSAFIHDLQHLVQRLELQLQLLLRQLQGQQGRLEYRTFMRNCK